MKNEEGELIFERGRMVLKIGRDRIQMAEGINIPSEHAGLFTADFLTKGYGRQEVVTKIAYKDDDGEMHAFQEYISSSAPDRKKKSSTKISQKEKEELKKINKARAEHPACAPYNFIPLNKTIATVPNAPLHSSFAKGNLSGYIDLTIENQTAFFVRKESEDQRFFNMTGTPFVPGSSLRGLIRSHLEIMTWSELKEGFFNNQRLSFRSLADMAIRLREFYKAEMPDTKALKTIKAGYLHYDPKDECYYITPSAGDVDRFESKAGPKKPEKVGDKYKVYSGMMPNKKEQWKIGPPLSSQRLALPQDLVASYQDDRTRDTKVGKDKLDLLREVKTNSAEWPDGYPVFYAENNSVISSFGHTPIYRLPYRYKIGDHIQQDQITDKNKTDFAKAIFGTTEFAGRVWFEDSYLKDGNSGFFPMQRTAQLMGPKPTTFQHYLEQKPDGIKTKLEALKHWGDENVQIRGAKQYWHRGTQENGNTAAETWKYIPDPRKASKGDNAYDQNPIEAMRPGAKFEGRIRFDNLSSVELGALIMAIELPQNCCHKLGLGKPLGLGTVRLNPSLTLIDRKARYTQLFDANGTNWNSGERTNVKTEGYKTAFIEYLGKAISHPMTTENDFWKEPRMATLYAMLSYDKAFHASAKWLKETRYMEIDRAGVPKDEKNEYSKRPVLPEPNEVIDIAVHNKRPKQ